MSSSADISIIIPDFNSPVIDQVIEALEVQCTQVNETVEILVVGLDCPNLVRETTQVHLISSGKQVSPAEARNIGVQHAQGKILIFLDADCVPTRDWLRKMLGASRRWKDAGAISGSMIPEGPNYASIGVQIACFHEHLNLHPKGKRRLLASFSLLMTKDVWDKSGGFDPDLVIAEDVDFSVRLSILGFPLYLHPEAAVHHLHNRNSLGRLWRHSVESGRLSIGVRHRHRKWFRMTVLTKIRWLWWLLAPGISLLRTIQIYLRTPGLWRYLVYFPCVLVSKFGWCIGAGMSVTARNRFDEEQT